MAKEKLTFTTDQVILQRLNTLIYVTLDTYRPSLQEKIVKLSELGLNAGEIASIVAKPSNQVSAAMKKKVKPRA